MSRIQLTLEKLERQINFVTKGEYSKELEEIFNHARNEHQVNIFTVAKKTEELRRTNAKLRDLLINTCCNSFGVTRQQLFSKRKDAHYVEARHIAMYLMRKYNLLRTLVAIGKYFKRDHTTVINAVDKVKGFIEVDTAYKNRVIDIESIVFKEVLEEKWD